MKIWTTTYVMDVYKAYMNLTYLGGDKVQHLRNGCLTSGCEKLDLLHGKLLRSYASQVFLFQIKITVFFQFF